jgi:hypothetical protein
VPLFQQDINIGPRFVDVVAQGNQAVVDCGHVKDRAATHEQNQKIKEHAGNRSF